MNPLAAIDCGTNSTRLLLVDGRDGQVARLMRITRLGQGVDATGMLDPAAIARTVAVLDEYRRLLDDHAVGAVRMVATSAARDASNGQVFLDAAARAIGVPAELLSGEEEGRLAFAGATSDLSPSGDVHVVVDIGGGSTELVVGTGAVTASEPGRGLGVVSLDLGCVRLTERFFHHDPPLAEEQAACDSFVAAELARALSVVPDLEGEDRAGRRLVGLAGTVSTLSMLDQGLREYDWDRVHHSVLALGVVEHWCAVLLAEPASARALRAGMVKGRQDVIAGGAVVLREVMRRLGFSHCLVSESDILDGLVASLRHDSGSPG
ncbi:MAG: exopolyphosphatase [Acidimicrobiales bacterium]